MIRKPISVLITLIALATIAGAAAQGRFVGGRSEVSNVRANKEVQELGRYCVLQYNRSAGHHPTGAAPLMFVQVVEAQTQVVAGIKYFLKVEAVQGGARRVFDAQVVVKPWLQSKELLSFAPSTNFV